MLGGVPQTKHLRERMVTYLFVDRSNDLGIGAERACEGDRLPTSGTNSGVTGEQVIRQRLSEFRRTGVHVDLQLLEDYADH